MSEMAILMAAGLGSRMRPLTETIPKPLVKVHNKPMIETVLDGLKNRGICEFYVVTGYLGDQFQYLEEKYDGLRIVENNEYETVNNISSIRAVSDILKRTENDVFICEADLYVRDRNLFKVTLDHSCYFGKMVKGHSDDWVFNLDDKGRIVRVGKVGDDCYNMVGIAYFKSLDARLLGHFIDEAYDQGNYRDLFWDDVVDRNLKKIDLTVKEISEEQLVEIDTIDELILLDDTYGCYRK